MVPHIPAPIQGQPLKSSWGAAVAESCNAMRQIGAGGLVRAGAGGFGMEQLPANQRGRRATSVDNGCWKIVRTESGFSFSNQFVMIGGLLKNFDISTTIDELVDAVEIPEDGSNVDLFIALRLAADGSDKEEEIKGYSKINDLAEDQQDFAWHTLPIYLLKVYETETENGQKKRSWAIKCDFRRGIFAQQWEAL